MHDHQQGFKKNTQTIMLPILLIENVGCMPPLQKRSI